MLWFIANYSRESSFGEIIAIAKFWSELPCINISLTKWHLV